MVLDARVFDVCGTELSTPACRRACGCGAQRRYCTDPETGPLHLSQRHLDPSQDQLPTRDPLGYGGGMDLYAYVGNAPTTQIDPPGLGPQPGQDWGKNVVEFIAGVGYGMSFGTIRSAWHAEDVEDVIDYNSPFFKSGTALGMTHTVLTAAVTGGAALSFLRARLVALVGAGATAAAGGSQAVENESGPVKGALASLMEGTPYQPGQQSASASKIGQLAELMKRPGFEWSSVMQEEPIPADENGVIRQGHHRIIAAYVAGIQIPQGIVGTGTPFPGNPIGWRDVWVLK